MNDRNVKQTLGDRWLTSQRGQRDKRGLKGYECNQTTFICMYSNRIMKSVKLFFKCGDTKE
jgi:hypothetical protein